VVIKKEDEFIRFKEIYLSLDNKDRTIRKMMKYGFNRFKCKSNVLRESLHRCLKILYLP
jgi:hypothetical protein